MGKLTTQEKRVLELIAQGFSNRQIAEKLNVSLAVIKACSEVLYKKLGAHNRVQAVVKAITQNIIKI